MAGVGSHAPAGFLADGGERQPIRARRQSRSTRSGHGGAGARTLGSGARTLGSGSNVHWRSELRASRRHGSGVGRTRIGRDPRVLLPVGLRAPILGSNPSARSRAFVKSSSAPKPDRERPKTCIGAPAASVCWARRTEATSAPHERHAISVAGVLVPGHCERRCAQFRRAGDGDVDGFIDVEGVSIVGVPTVFISTLRFESGEAKLGHGSPPGIVTRTNRRLPPSRGVARRDSTLGASNSSIADLPMDPTGAPSLAVYFVSLSLCQPTAGRMMALEIRGGRIRRSQRKTGGMPSMETASQNDRRRGAGSRR